MKFFKLKFGEHKEREVRLSSIGLLNLVESRAPIWQPHRHRNKKKKLANETKRECWRQIAKKLVGHAYLEAKVNDRLEIEQSLKARFHAMRDQWVKCRNRNKSYAFEEHIKFLSQRHFEQEPGDFYEYDDEDDNDNDIDNDNDHDHDMDTKVIILSADDIKKGDPDDFDEIDRDSTVIDENDIMPEEHIQIEIAHQPTPTEYFEENNIITEYPPCTPPLLCKRDSEHPPSSPPAHHLLTLLSKQEPLQLQQQQEFSVGGGQYHHYQHSQGYREHHHREASPSSPCSCHCHKDAQSVKQMENYLFGKAIATLLNNMDGEKLFETKKAILSCIVKDIYIVDAGKK